MALPAGKTRAFCQTRIFARTSLVDLGSDLLACEFKFCFLAMPTNARKPRCPKQAKLPFRNGRARGNRAIPLGAVVRRLAQSGHRAQSAC